MDRRRFDSSSELCTLMHGRIYAHSLKLEACGNTASRHAVSYEGWFPRTSHAARERALGKGFRFRVTAAADE